LLLPAPLPSLLAGAAGCGREWRWWPVLLYILVVLSWCCMLRQSGVMPFRSVVPLVRSAGWRLGFSAGELPRWERWLVGGSGEAPQNKRSGAKVRADLEVWCSSPWRHGGGEKRDVHVILVKAGSTASRETRAHGLPWALHAVGTNGHCGVNQRRLCLPTLSMAIGAAPRSAARIARACSSSSRRILVLGARIPSSVTLSGIVPRCVVGPCALRSSSIGGEEEGWDCFSVCLIRILLAICRDRVVIFSFLLVLFVVIYSPLGQWQSPGPSRPFPVQKKIWK
jgi:hypothetical protein